MINTGVWIVLSLSVACLSYLLIQLALSVFKSYRHSFTQHTQVHLSDIFLFLDPRQVWQLTIFLASLVFIFSYILISSIGLSSVLAIGSLFFPKFLLQKLRKNRCRHFDQQLPDALWMLSGTLRSGVSIQTALIHIQKEAMAPLSQEFGLVLKEQRLGLGIEQSLVNLEQRMNTEGCSLFVAALRIANETGGNLADTLENIAELLRQRHYLEGRIHSLTSQGVLQMWTVSGLPFVLMWVLHYLNPEEMQQLWTTQLGWLLLGVIVILEGFGIWWIRKIIHIDI